jgi:hypothetical protein
MSYKSLIESQNIIEFIKSLETFNETNEKQFKFETIPVELKNKFVSYLQELIEINSYEKIDIILTSIRLMSREKSNEILMNDRLILNRIKHLIDDNKNSKLVINALKCLTNIVFNSPAASKILLEEFDLCKCWIEKFLANENFVEQELLQRNTLILKCIFVITAYNQSQIGVLNDAKIMEFLTKFIDKLMSETPDMTLDVNQVDFLVECLKLMYNLTLNFNYADFSFLANVLRDLLLFKTQDDSKKSILIGNIVNLLTNINPPEAYSNLIIDLKNPQSSKTKKRFYKLNLRSVIMNEDALFGNYFCLPLKVLVDYLNDSLKAYFKDEDQIYLDHLQPIILALYFIARSNPISRKYLRAEILPPLKGEDIYRLPTEGTKTRNYLARLMTHTNLQVKRLSAQLIYTLCKENISRLIKYTGFGNAAGLIADLGLLANRPQNEDKNENSDDTDSDTEDYRKAKDQINHVKGCFDAKINMNIFDGCTEEQKMFMVDQLMAKFDQLNTMGLIRPAVIDEATGKPKAVEHILEFVDKNTTKTTKEED